LNGANLEWKCPKFGVRIVLLEICRTQTAALRKTIVKVVSSPTTWRI
jgi:hypothetical protein